MESDAPFEIVRAPDVESWLPWVIVPEIVSAANDCPEDSVIVFDEPVKVTVEEVEVIVAMDEESQEPAMETFAELKLRTADAPEVVRSELKVGEEEVRVSVPVKVTALTKVVETPESTVRFAIVVGMFTVPPDTFTMTVEVPSVKVPADVSMLLTVRVEPRASRIPPNPTVRVMAWMGKFEALVSSVVVEETSATVRVPPTFRPRLAMTKVCAVPAALEKVTLLNSSTVRLDPAKVIVPPVLDVKVTVPEPADHDADAIEPFVQVPEKDQEAPPNEKYPVALMVTSPETLTAPEAPAEIPPDKAAREAIVRSYVSAASTPLTVVVPPMFKAARSVLVTPPFTVRLFSV